MENWPPTITNKELNMTDKEYPQTDIGVHEGNPQTFLMDQPGHGDNAPADQGAALKIIANIGLELGRHAKEIEKHNRRLWAKLQYATPVNYRNVASGVFATGVPLVLNFGGPDQGTFWELENLAVGGTDINVTAAGSFGLYVSGYVANGVSPGMGALVDGANDSGGGAAILPYTQTYGGRNIVINESESLYVVIFSGTNNQQYVANMAVTVWKNAAGLGNDVNVL